MTNPDSTPIGETLEEMLERAIFADPITQRLRDERNTTKKEVQKLFEKACREQYEELLVYHQTCDTPEPEDAARAEGSALCILLIEERDQRLAMIWGNILRRVNAVLAEKKAAREELDG